jgi:hypothetical protein
VRTLEATVTAAAVLAEEYIINGTLRTPPTVRARATRCKNLTAVNGVVRRSCGSVSMATKLCPLTSAIERGEYSWSAHRRTRHDAAIDVYVRG